MAQVDARGGVIVAGKFASGIKTQASLKAVGTISVYPGTVAAGATAVRTASLPGAAVGDLVFVQPPDTLEDGLVLNGAAVTAADTVTVAITNVTANNITGANREWAFLLFEA